MRLPSIAIVAPTLERIGGMRTQARTLAAQLQKEGYAVSLIPFEPRFPPRLQWVRRYPYVRTLLNQSLYLPSLLRLRQADVAHVFSGSYWPFLLSPLPAIVVGRLMGKRVLLNYRSGEAEDHLSRWGVLVHPWLRLVDEIIVPSVYLRKVFARHGYRALIIPNVVDTARFRYRERSPLRLHLLSVRNFESYYRVDNTLKAFALLKAKYPEATLTIAGYGSKEGWLRHLATSLGSDGILFVGRVPPEDMPGLYGEADIFVNSSVIDNQPVSVLEAFASGLPVVSTGAGDIANMVRDGETGFLVPPDDPAAIVKAVTSLLDDPERALNIARRARQEVAQYTWPRVREQWAAVYAGRAA